MCVWERVTDNWANSTARDESRCWLPSSCMCKPPAHDHTLYYTCCVPSVCWTGQLVLMPCSCMPCFCCQMRFGHSCWAVHCAAVVVAGGISVGGGAARQCACQPGLHVNVGELLRPRAVHRVKLQGPQPVDTTGTCCGSVPAAVCCRKAAAVCQ